jgi:VIT1/CCC1 family predicted Fe2+/Mn2+ transporter
MASRSVRYISSGSARASRAKSANTHAERVCHASAARRVPGRAGDRDRRRRQHGLLRRLPDTGHLTGRSCPYTCGAITGAGTFLGGILHTLLFVISQYQPAVLLALAVIALELLALAWIRGRFFGASFLSSLITVTLGEVIIATVSAALG